MKEKGWEQQKESLVVGYLYAHFWYLQTIFFANGTKNLKRCKNDIESTVVWKLQLMGRMIEKVKVPSYRSRKNCISWERFISAWNHLGEVYYGGAGFTAVQFYQIGMPSVITRRHDNDVCFNLLSSLWPYYIFAEG